MEIRNRPLKIV